MTIPITQSEFAIVPFESAIARTFSANGYTTRFIYSGRLSWSRLDDFLPHQGFEYLHGDAEYPDNVVRTDWGVHDEEVFKLALKLLREADRPQFIVLLTTSNHPPFQLPPAYQVPELVVPPALSREISDDFNRAVLRFQCFAYSAGVVAAFLDTLAADPRIENTVVAVTGDHNFGGVRLYDDEELLDYVRVPFFIRLPRAMNFTPRVFHTLGDHTDIAPTLYHLVLPGAQYISFGRDLVGTGFSRAVTEEGMYFHAQGALKYHFGDHWGLFFQWRDTGRWELVRIPGEATGWERAKTLVAYLSAASYYRQYTWDRNATAFTLVDSLQRE